MTLLSGRHAKTPAKHAALGVREASGVILPLSSTRSLLRTCCQQQRCVLYTLTKSQERDTSWHRRWTGDRRQALSAHPSLLFFSVRQADFAQRCELRKAAELRTKASELPCKIQHKSFARQAYWDESEELQQLGSAQPNERLERPLGGKLGKSLNFEQPATGLPPLPPPRHPLWEAGPPRWRIFRALRRPSAIAPTSAKACCLD